MTLPDDTPLPSPSRDPNSRPLQNADLVVVAAITFLTLFVFGGAARYEFVDLDHHFYVGNPNIQEGLTLDGIRWAFTSVVGSNWHPVTMLAHMTVHQFFGASTAAHHLVNVFLHLANALLVFALLRRWTGAVLQSGVVALLFSLHPLRVESVVWTAELKDVLSTFWVLLAIVAYARYATRRAIGWYFVALALFALALMTKASVVVLPMLLLILDWWPLMRLNRSNWRGPLLEKVPLLLLAGGMSAITLLTFSDSTLKSTDTLSFGYRAVMSLQAYFAYLVQTVAPLRLAPHYPYAPLERPAVQLIVPIVVLGAVTAFAIHQRHRRPYLLAGWLWFVIAIVPVSGILPVGSHYRADRYTYLAHIGLFAAIVWAVGSLAIRAPRLRPMVTALAGLAVAAYAVLSYVNVQYWRNGLTLFSHGVRVSPNSSLMHSGLATAYIQASDFESAETELREALRLDPDELRDWKRLAGLLLLRDKAQESADIYLKIAEQEPGVAQNYLLLALALEKTGNIAEARRWAAEAQRLDPNNPDIADTVRRLAL